MGDATMSFFVERKKATTYLRGHRKEAVAVQILVFLAEVGTMTSAFWLPGSDVLVIACGLLIDLLMISPLKAGRALFFETLVADGEAAQFSLIFRYYRYGYERALGWRLITWGYRLLWSALLYLPALWLFAFSDALAQDAPAQKEIILSMAMFGLGLLLLAAAWIIVEILLLRLVAIPYLLSHTGSLKNAVSLSRKLTKRRTNALLLMYLDHAGWFLTSIFLFPWFYTSARFQTARAATIRQFLRQNPPRNAKHVLQRRKKYGRISGNSN